MPAGSPIICTGASVRIGCSWTSTPSSRAPTSCEVLRASLQQTAAMLVVIGPRWTSLRAADGTRRLDDPNDFVRLEVETALGRSIPVVPVLVQGATLPRKEDLPASLDRSSPGRRPSLDHAEFHDDVERLCDRLAPLIEDDTATLLVAAAAVVARGGAGGDAGARIRRIPRDAHQRPGTTAVTTAENVRRRPRLIHSQNRHRHASRRRRRRPGTAAAHRRARARHVASRRYWPRRRPSVAAASPSRRWRRWRVRENWRRPRTSVRQTQEDVAMDWIRNVRVESGKSSFGDAIKPALAVVDASLPTATGTRRADLLAHSGLGHLPDVARRESTIGSG